MPRQTQSYLRSLFAQRGISPRHRLGQNFLIDLNIHELIVDAAGVGPATWSWRSGRGPGPSRRLMASRGASVVAVDVDPAMAALTEEAVADLVRTSGCLNIDALASKNALNPVVLETCVQRLAAGTAQAASSWSPTCPTTSRRRSLRTCLSIPCSARRMVVTIQRELAERMIACPVLAAYGALSVLIQALADCSIVRVLPPSVFWPRPKVESAVVSVRPDPQRRAAIDVSWFHEVLRKVFFTGGRT